MTLPNGLDEEIQKSNKIGRPAFKNSYSNWEKLCPNLSFSVEKKKKLHKITQGTFQTEHHKWDAQSPLIWKRKIKREKIISCMEKWAFDPMKCYVH